MNSCSIAPVLNSKGYSIDWNDIVRPAVLKAFGYKCADCGVSNRTYFTYDKGLRQILDDNWLLDLYKNKEFKLSKIALSISHECHTKACINLKHLKPRCQSCHLRYDKHIHLLSRLQGVRKKV
jgi:hypothetical protein